MKSRASISLLFTVAAIYDALLDPHQLQVLVRHLVLPSCAP